MGNALVERGLNQLAIDIKKKMEENSKAWHTADSATRKKLEAENKTNN